MRPPRRPHLPRTLRGRLVSVLVLLLTVGFVAAALVTTLVVRHVLLDRLDTELRAAGDRFSVGLEHDDNDGDSDAGASRYGDVEGQSAGTLGARISGGRVTAAAIVGDHDTEDRVPAAARARLARLAADPAPRSVELPGLGTYRVIVAPGRDGDRQVTGLPAEPVEDVIHKLVLFEVAVFAVTLLAVGLASTGLVRLMLRPLGRVADTAGEVSALTLGSGGVSLPHRVEVGTTGSEIDTLARAFNAMLEQVEAALVTRADSEDRLRRFVADASHELRTPVAVVRSHAELAQRTGADGAGAPLPDQVVHSLERITAQAARMGHIVEDLLLLARLDSGRPLEHVEVDIVRIALDAVDDARATTADHRWRLALPEHSVWVDGDPHALGEAVANLLANGATHTPPGTTVTLSVTELADATVDGAGPRRAVQLCVSDDGPGMSAELAARAFDRFVRGDGTRSLGRGSSGLGLAIVSAVVAAHGGTVALDPSTHGTTVRLLLPARSCAGTGDAEAEAADADSAGADS